LGDVGEYKRSLRRLRELEPDRLVPMHGPGLTDPTTRMEASLEDAERTERRLLKFFDDRGRAFARGFVTDVLDVEGTRAPFLTLVIYEYLYHLQDRDLISVEVTEDGIRAGR